MKKILLPLFAVAALTASAQKAANKLSFQKGQTFEVTTTMDMNLQTQMGDMPGKMMMIDLYTVNDVTADRVEMTKTSKRSTANFTMMGQEMKMDSDDPKSLDNPMAGPIKEMVGKKYDFTIDPYGKIIAVKGEEAKKAEGGGMMGMSMPGMGDAAPAVGQSSLFKVLPSAEVKAGDKWTDSVSADGNKNVTAYTVKDISNDEIHLDYTGNSTLNTTQSAMGQTVQVTGTTKAGGTVTVDKATGLLKQRTSTANTESVMNMAGQEMNISSKITSTTTVKTL